MLFGVCASIEASGSMTQSLLLQKALAMKDSIDELTSRFLKSCHRAGESEKLVVERLTQRLHISRNVSAGFDETMTLGQRVSDRIALFGGSWTFIILFLVTLLIWIVLNVLVLTRIGQPFDPYPFIFLNLILSMVAALQAPVIMMSQNRQSAKDRAAAAHDYEVNLKAELEILALHQKLDQLREQQWTELVSMQRQQIELLIRLVEPQK